MRGGCGDHVVWNLEARWERGRFMSLERKERLIESMEITVV